MKKADLQESDKEDRPYGFGRLFGGLRCRSWKSEVRSRNAKVKTLTSSFLVHPSSFQP